MIKQENKTEYKVLIVDDVAELRSFLGRCLKQIGGYEVHHAKDGVDCLQQLRKKHIDIVFLDIEMPKQNGLETLEYIHKCYPYIFVIMLSCHSSLANVKTAISSGAHGFIVKPFSPDKIEESLSHFHKNVAKRRLKTSK